MPKIRFDHIHLRSPNPEATAAWFAETLGAEVIRSTPGGKPRIDLKLGGQDIFIAEADAAVAAAPSSPYQGLDHIGLFVEGLDEVAAELKAKGVTFTMEPKQARPGVRICFIRGPENISIELLERTPA
ncbi:VOC family protein [Siccirubricoccus sp. KC 17139]|uniref:VOC family protein n=1 Tax=Siccirubricoccus soli TaxID=2899147 RepID=A0ABT1CYY3_9PROT|nr:VOC family protein [Siccirubricoccus soli]MCO6414878.1 VOC family protein [Siccirubricoccus soli]MCP2681008.1 VOC family protein [Siccirubricoccus soli]